MPQFRLDVTEYISTWQASPLARFDAAAPWRLCADSRHIVRQLIGELSTAEYRVSEDVGVHKTAIVESGAVLKGPLIVGPRCFVASGAYLRDGNWLAADCTIGPGAEIKSSFVFAGTKLAHFNFVGDSILGERVNLEAGSIICNYRNERAEKEIRVRLKGELYGAGVTKFGALVGDDCRIGANAVVAPGGLLDRGFVLDRTRLLDQEQCSEDLHS